MLTRTAILAAGLLLAAAVAADASQAQTKSTAKQPAAAQAPARLPVGTKDVPTKQQIMNSPQWRRAMFEFGEWLTAQQLYDKQQVAEIKRQFNERVAKATPEELAVMLADLEAKFQIIETPEAKEARAWMGQYLSVMSDKKKAEVLRNMPNLVTMSAAQLNAELTKIEQKKSNLEGQQEAFERGQAAQVTNQLATDRTAQQNFIHDWNSGPVSYSPYQSNSNVNQRLNNTPTGSGMGFYVSPWGGVGMTFSPSSW